MKVQKHVRFDWAIKRLLKQRANFGILEGFLSELIGKDVKIVEILDGENNKETAEDKYNRVDVLVKDKKGDMIIIEVQNSYAIDYFLRNVYKGMTNYKGIHDNKILNLTAAQKKYFKKKKVEDIHPEIYLIKVNTFDDNAKDTLDEWIYFLKNSEIKQEFSAKGLKEADETLKVANMSDKERREYKRFVEVLSDRASIAETIQITEPVTLN